nr:VOC family protein [Cohnella sp. WQ 127256]
MACWSADGGQEDHFPDTTHPISARISGTFVDVKDMRKASSWYTNLLGLPVDEHSATQSIYSVPVAQGSSLLLDSNRYVQQEAFNILFMFDTCNIQAAYDYALHCGMSFHGQLEHHGEVSFFVLKDPDENLIMICQDKSR